MNAEGARHLIREMSIEMERLNHGFARLQRLFADSQECECEYDLKTLERELLWLYKADDGMRSAEVMLIRILDALREEQIISEEGGDEKTP